MQYFGRKKDINVPRALKKRRKNEKIAKNTPKNEKSFEKTEMKILKVTYSKQKAMLKLY